MTDEERQAWWRDAGKGFFPWRVHGRPGRFFTWLWLTTTAYVWNAGFQQFAATRQGLHVDWNTAGFALPVLILLVLGSITFMFKCQAARKSLTALSLFLIHVFASNLATLAAWELMGVNPHVVTARSMVVETAVAATGALPILPSAAVVGMPLTVSIVLLSLRNISPERLTVYLPLVACLLWVLLACQGLRLT